MTELTENFACRLTIEQRNFLTIEGKRGGRTGSEIMRDLIDQAMEPTTMIDDTPARGLEPYDEDDGRVSLPRPILPTLNDNRPLVAKVISPFVRRERFDGVRIIECEKHIFEQIHEPEITEENHDEYLEQLEVEAIGFTIIGSAVYIIALSGKGLWKWWLTEPELWDAARNEHPWLQELLQVFLVY